MKNINWLKTYGVMLIGVLKFLKILLIGIWYFYCAPGYVLLWIAYFYPTKNRFAAETLRDSRQYRRRHIFAPINALGGWFLIFYFIPEVWVYPMLYFYPEFFK